MGRMASPRAPIRAMRPQGLIDTMHAVTPTAPVAAGGERSRKASGGCVPEAAVTEAVSASLFPVSWTVLTEGNVVLTLARPSSERERAMMFAPMVSAVAMADPEKRPVAGETTTVSPSWRLTLWKPSYDTVWATK